MGCNGWNHASDCICGWGGDTRSGTGGTIVNLSSSLPNRSPGGKIMAECKVTKKYIRYRQLFDKCCEVLLKMNMDILTSSSSSHLFEVEAREWDCLANKIKIEVEWYGTAQSKVIAAELSNVWSTAKIIIDKFFAHLEN